MIRILQDLGNLLGDHSYDTVEAIADYPRLYARVEQHLLDKQDYTLVVQVPVVTGWFRQMAKRYPAGSFQFEVMDEHAALARRWSLTLPDDVSNEEIKQTGLLSLRLHPQPGQTFDDLLLTHFYHPLLAAPALPSAQLSRLLQELDLPRWQETNRQPLLFRILQRRLQQWKEAARSGDVRRLIELFAQDPAALRQALMTYRAVQHDPTLGTVLLGDDFALYSALKLPLDDLRIDERQITQAVQEITYQLNAHTPQNVEEYTSWVQDMSGLLGVEWQMAYKVLDDHPAWITHETIGLLERKFLAHHPRLQRQTEALRLRIRPPKPQQPDAAWDVKRMLQWALDEYLPYHTYCDSQNQFEPELYQTGDQFSAWLYDNWLDIHANSKRMVFNILSNKAPVLMNTGNVHLVLVIDNLAWSYVETLKSLFQEQAFFLTEAEPYFAMLPTETEISKKCLLAGEVGYTDIDHTNYTKMVEQGWVPYFGTDTFHYVSDIGQLLKLKKIDASVYVVNYLAIDKVLHQSADEIGMPHREHIQNLLEKLVENVAAFAEAHELQDTLRIHVVSDHGSTRIPSNINNDLDPAFFKKDMFEARSHRYVKVNAQQFNNLADNLQVDCFFLPANTFHNPENFLCARRANRFIATDQRVYVHGGLLPEEVIVPYLAFEPASVPLQALTVRLTSNEFRYRLETVSMEIGNPNHFSIENIEVQLLNGNMEYDPIIIQQLPGSSKTALTMPVRFKPNPSADDQKRLWVRLRYMARGEWRTNDANLPIIMRKLVEEVGGSIFDDLD